MNNVLLNLIYFISSYILVFLIYALVLYRRKKKEFKQNLEVEYIINKFKLDKRKIDYNKLKWILTIVNPFIISITFLVVINVDSFILGIIISFVIMMALIYSIYEIIGRYLKKHLEKQG